MKNSCSLKGHFYFCNKSKYTCYFSKYSTSNCVNEVHFSVMSIWELLYVFSGSTEMNI